MNGFDEALQHGGNFAGFFDHGGSLIEEREAYRVVDFLSDVKLGSEFGARAFGDSEEADGVLVAVAFVAFGDV